MKLGACYSHQHLVRNAKERFSMSNWCNCFYTDKPTFKVSWVFELRLLDSIGLAPGIEDLTLTAMFLFPWINQVCYWHIGAVCMVNYLGCTFYLFLLFLRLLSSSRCSFCSGRGGFFICFCRRQQMVLFFICNLWSVFWLDGIYLVFGKCLYHDIKLN